MSKKLTKNNKHIRRNKMNKLILLFLFGLSLMFPSCSHKIEETRGGYLGCLDSEDLNQLTSGNALGANRYEQEIASPKNLDCMDSEENMKKKPFVDVIFEKEVVVTEDIFVGHVNTGDEVKISVTGIDRTVEFSGVYQKPYDIQWEDVNCVLTKHGDECSNVTRTAQCKANYRDYLGKAELPIDFKQEDKMPLKFKIGDESYSIDKFELDDKYTMSGVFTVDKSMLQDSNELHLRPPFFLSFFPDDTTNVGFLDVDYKTCSPRPPETAYMIISSNPVLHRYPREFTVDLEIIRGKGLSSNESY